MTLHKSTTAIAATLLCLCTLSADAAPARDRAAHERHQQQVLYDVYEISNLMGTYVAYNRAAMDRQIVPMFALATPGVAVEFPGEGRFVGAQEVRARLVKATLDIEAKDPFLHGRAQEHTLTSPVIVVADDGQTAKAIWSMPGWETIALPINQPGEPVELKVQAFWAWGKYGVDFVKEDGRWKIWHLHVYPTFFTRYDTDWVKTGGFQGGAPEPAPGGASAPAPAGAPLKGSQPNGPSWSYREDRTPPPNLPQPPVAYRSFSQTFSY